MNNEAERRAAVCYNNACVKCKAVEVEMVSIHPVVICPDCYQTMVTNYQTNEGIYKELLPAWREQQMKLAEQ